MLSEGLERAEGEDPVGIKNQREQLSGTGEYGISFPSGPILLELFKLNWTDWMHFTVRAI